MILHNILPWFQLLWERRSFGVHPLVIYPRPLKLQVMLVVFRFCHTPWKALSRIKNIDLWWIENNIVWYCNSIVIISWIRWDRYIYAYSLWRKYCDHWPDNFTSVVVNMFTFQIYPELVINSLIIFTFSSLFSKEFWASFNMTSIFSNWPADSFLWAIHRVLRPNCKKTEIDFWKLIWNYEKKKDIYNCLLTNLNKRTNQCILYDVFFCDFYIPFHASA